MKKRILLVSVSAGSGHVRAAEALRTSGIERHPDWEIKHIDLMDYVPTPVKKIVVDAYSFMVDRAPALYGFFYKKTAQEEYSARKPEFIKQINKFTSKKFFKYVKDFKPDVIISTYPFVGLALSQADKTLKKIPFFVTVTDYGVHNFWVSPNVKKYFVGNERMKSYLEALGVSPGQTIVSGIPVHSVFYEKKKSEELRKKFRFSPKLPFVLILSGGKGMMRCDLVIDMLLHSIEDKRIPPCHIVTVVGKNEKLRITLDKIKKQHKNSHLGIVGWTDEIDEYMRMADVIITKSGGLTTSECMTVKKPMIVMYPIPGQEEENVHYILDSGSGVVAYTPQDLAFYVDEILHKKRKFRFPVYKKKTTEVIWKEIEKEL